MLTLFSLQFFLNKSVAICYYLAHITPMVIPVNQPLSVFTIILYYEITMYATNEAINVVVVVVVCAFI